MDLLNKEDKFLDGQKAKNFIISMLSPRKKMGINDPLIK